MSRTWGFWTRGKLDILRNYLAAFSTASKRAPERLYLDLFAGSPDNRDRLTNESIPGSARIALSIDSPHFTELVFFELDDQAASLEQSLRSEFSDRRFRVVPGDCNSTIHHMLAELSHMNRAPTFAFIDPNGPDIHWSTIDAIARFKRSGLTKAELWLLFPVEMFIRMLPVDGTVRQEDADRITRMYGTQQWRDIYDARVSGALQPRDARGDYLNLMRWRLENELYYAQTHSLEIRNEQGSPMYHMIFATDHDAGTKIMSDLYARAAAEFPAMRNEARQVRRDKEREERGEQRLFDVAALKVAARRGTRLYKHEPPQEPWFIANS